MSHRSLLSLTRVAEQLPPAALSASLLFGVAVNAAAQGGFSYGSASGAQLYQQNCVGCHAADEASADAAAAPLAALRELPPEQIFESITMGDMAQYVASIEENQKRDLTEFVAGQPFIDIEGLGIARMTNPCAANPPLGDLDASASWVGWGPKPNNSRFQTAEAAGLTREGVPDLELKWAFGIPGGGIMASQPTVALGRVFIAGDNGFVYSLSATTGCAYWAYATGISGRFGRFAPIVAPIEGYAATNYAVFLTADPGIVYAVDARDGELLWKTELNASLSLIRNSSTYDDGRLYVPLAGSETLIGAGPEYECCRSRGGVAALDANTGEIIWQVESIPGPLRKLAETADGQPVWGPSGASVWNAPTVDAERGVIYVGTGNSYGPVAAETSDSILALDMDDGHLVWSHQEFAGDAFMVGCPQSDPDNPKCPENLGPDWDFGGASAVLQTLPNGRDVLIAAGKGGIAIALDPDNEGEVLWRTRLYEGQPPSALGLVLFGGTADGEKVYYPLQQPGGGLVALELEDGDIAWRADIETDRRGQSAAATSMPGVVFTGGWDGIMRAVDSTTGEVIWTYNAVGSYEDTVNGVPANGGSFGVTGPSIASGMLYVGAGYIGIQGGTPGNVLLAFGVEE